MPQIPLGNPNHDHAAHNPPIQAFLVGLGHATLVTGALVLVSANFLVFALTLLHECCELGVVVLGNCFGSHLDLAVAARFRNVLLDVDNGLLKARNSGVLIETL